MRLAAVTAAVAAGFASLAAYLLDRDLGARRRNRLLDAATSLGHKAADAADATARDAANRATGLVAEARRAIRPEVPSDAVLEARVKTALGRAARHSGALSVAASGGHVTLSGPVLRVEAPRILATAWNVPGVLAIEDRLDVRDEPGDIPALQGHGPQPEPRPDLLQTTWAPTTRLIAVLSGVAAVVVGLGRGGAVGILAAIAGALFALRGATNLAIGRVLGVAGGRRAIDAHKTLELDAPIEAAYDLWSRYERFPEFMTHVREVRPLGGGRSHWVVEGPAGMPVEFDALETKHVTNEVIAWKSADGELVRHSGIVRFEPRPGERSRVDVRMTYNPPAGVAGHLVAGLFGVDPKRALDDDLLRFQSLLAHGKTTADDRETTLAELGVDPNRGRDVRIPPLDRTRERIPAERPARPPAGRVGEPPADAASETMAANRDYPPVDTYLGRPRESS